MVERKMNTQEKISIDNNWKTIAKKIIEMNYNYNDYEKEVLKFLLDMYHEYNKSVIIKNKQQAQIIEKLLNQNS